MGHTLNPESLGFCSRVATIHAGWDFGESLCISEYVDFPHMGIRYLLTARGDGFVRLFQVQLQRQADPLAVCHQAFLSLFGIYIYIYMYMGNDYTSGRNSTPAAGANCCKYLLSLLQVKFPLSFLIKRFFFGFSCFVFKFFLNPPKSWLF